MNRMKLKTSPIALAFIISSIVPMPAAKVVIGLVMAAAAATEALSNFPRATVGDGFMHLPIRSVYSTGELAKREAAGVEVDLTNRLELYTVESKFDKALCHR